MTINSDPLASIIYEAKTSSGAMSDKTISQKVDAVLDAAQSYADGHSLTQNAVKALSQYAGHIPDGSDKEKIVTKVLELNEEVGKLDWAQALINLTEVAKLNTAADRNDSTIISQFGKLINNDSIAPIGKFRLALEITQKAPSGSSLEKSAVTTATNLMSVFSEHDMQAARKELKNLEKEGKKPLLEALSSSSVSSSHNMVTELTAEGVQRDTPTVAGSPNIPLRA